MRVIMSVSIRVCILAYAVFFKRASNGPVKDINSKNIVTVLFFFVFFKT